MRFQEAYEGWQEGRLTQAEAAVLLDQCERSFRRHIERFEADGLQGGYHLAAVVIHGLCTWTLIYLAIGFALACFDYESPWTLYLSQSSCWVFLLHLPVVAFAGWWLLQFDLPAVVKFLGVVSFTTVICFLSYQYGVQKTWVSVFLNGQRFNLKWPWQK